MTVPALPSVVRGAGARVARELDVRPILAKGGDPETGLNLIDLGLIYEVRYDPEVRVIEVLMTLTTPACPAGAVMQDGVERRLGREPGVERVDVRVTFEPPWTPERISPEGRAQLGW